MRVIAPCGALGGENHHLLEIVHLGWQSELIVGVAQQSLHPQQTLLLNYNKSVNYH